MVFIITGSAESGRKDVGTLLANALGWDFIEAENLAPLAHCDADRGTPSLPKTNSGFRVEALTAAINFWLYEWRDAVVSCPMLTDNDQRQLSNMSSLVKVVCLQPSYAATSTPVINLRAGEYSDGPHAERDSEQPVLTVDSSQQVGRVVSTITAAMVSGKSLRAEQSGDQRVGKQNVFQNH